MLTFPDFWVDVSVDAALMSPRMLFYGLVKLVLGSSCSRADGCTFSLTDDDATEIATALPNLVSAPFGLVHHLLPRLPFHPLQGFEVPGDPLQPNEPP